MTDGRHDSDPDDRWAPPRRSARLRELADGLPSVAHALDELIARANQAELGRSDWTTASDAEPPIAGELRDARAEAPIAGELRDANALRQRVDELQAALAAAEARAAAAVEARVAAAPGASAVEARVADAPQARGATPVETQGAKAAEARVATAGEARVATAAEAPRGHRWPMLMASFVGGAVVMFAVSRRPHDAPQPAPAPAAEISAPAVRSSAEPSSPQPTITPIEPTENGQPAAQPVHGSPPSPPVETPAIAAPTNPRTPRAGVRHPTTSGATPTSTPTTPTPAATAGQLADPFDEAAAKPARPVPPASRPAQTPTPSGQLVNPFSSSSP